MTDLVRRGTGPQPESGDGDAPPTRRRDERGLSRDLRRAGLLGGMGVIGFLDLLALEDITTSVQPDYVAETVLLLVSIPALVVLFTLWRRSATTDGPDDDAGHTTDPGEA